jgi:hypothetical protein
VKDRYSGIDLPAGRHVLNGAQSLAFVRQRHGLPNGDLDRTRRQQAFLTSVGYKLRHEGTLTNLSRLTDLMEVAKKDIVVDSGWDLMGFIREARSLSSGNVTFHTLPITGYATRSGQSVNLVDTSEVRSFIDEALTTHAGRPKHQLQVDVLNGTDREGLAARVAQALAARGYRTGDIANAPHLATTTVHYGAGTKTEAERIAHQLGVRRTQESPSLPSGHVRVVLGDDFALPPTGQPAEPSNQSPNHTTPTPLGFDGTSIPCVD